MYVCKGSVQKLLLNASLDKNEINQKSSLAVLLVRM